jgi:hypothetical protein
MFRVEDTFDQFTGSTVHVASTEHHLNNDQEVKGNGVKRVASMISSPENACHLEKNNHQLQRGDQVPRKVLGDGRFPTHKTHRLPVHT